MKKHQVAFGIMAIVAITALSSALLSCSGAPARDTLVEQIINTTGDRGALKLTLVWDEECDVDLHVIEPDDTHIYFGNRQPGGEGHGYLDHDNIHGGPRSMENVYWDAPMSGTYRWYIKLFSCSDTHPNVPCTVVAFKNGREIARDTHYLTHVGEEYHLINVSVD